MTRTAYLTKMKNQIVDLAKKNPEFEILETENEEGSVIVIFNKDNDGIFHFIKMTDEPVCSFSFTIDYDEYEYGLNSFNRFVRYDLWMQKHGYIEKAQEIPSRWFYKNMHNFINNLTPTGIQWVPVN